MSAEIKIGRYLSEGINVYKSNFAPLFVSGILGIIPGVQLNALSQVLRFRATGQPMTVGELFDFDNVVNKFVIGLIGSFPFIPILSLPLLADHPGTSFADAWKGGWAFGKNDPVGLILLNVVAVGVALIGLIGCCVGVVFTVPLLLPILAVAYDDHREAIQAAAKDAGVELPPAAVYGPVEE